MVADQDWCTGCPCRVEAAAAVGQHDRGASGGGGSTNGVNDRTDAAALVVVGAGAEDQCPAVGVPDRHRSYDARVPGNGGLGEARNVRIVNRGNRSPDQVTGLPPAGPQHQCHVMAGGPCAFGDHLGGGGGHREGVHGGIAQIQGVCLRVGHPGSLTQLYGSPPSRGDLVNFLNGQDLSRMPLSRGGGFSRSAKDHSKQPCALDSLSPQARLRGRRRAPGQHSYGAFPCRQLGRQGVRRTNCHVAHHPLL